jgi:hypothetical protein
MTLPAIAPDHPEWPETQYPYVFAWAEEFFAHYAPGEDAKRLASVGATF